MAASRVNSTRCHSGREYAGYVRVSVPSGRAAVEVVIPRPSLR